MKLILATSIAIALTFCSQLHAQQLEQSISGDAIQSVSISSAPGETIEQFANRANRGLSSLKSTTGQNACVTVSSSGDGFTASVQTLTDNDRCENIELQIRSLTNNVEGKDFSKFTSINAPEVGQVPYRFLFKEKSQTGESIDEFAARISDRLRSFSDKTGYEACGVIATNGDNYSVVVGSNEAHALCLNSKFFMEDGYELAGMTIHSHPRSSTYIVNKQDQIILGKLERIGTRFNTGDQKRLFSKEDFASGSGYLVSPFGDVYKQEGSAKTVQKIEKKSYLAQSL